MLDELAANPAPYDRDQEIPSLLRALNESDALVPVEQPPGAGGLRGLLQGLARRVLSPELNKIERSLARHRAFESNLVQFLNRFAVGSNSVAARNAEFTSALVRFSQRIDRLADAKDRLYASLGNSRMDLLLDAMDKRIQSVRLGLAKIQERLEGMSSALAIARAEIAAVDRPVAVDRERLEEAHYVAFEERFRGSSGELRQRFAEYVPLFQDRAPVVDLGCGRGEFLELLREARIDARGVDGNLDMVHSCEEKGLVASHDHVLSFLAASEPDSAGGIFAAQLIEHLTPKEMKRLLVESHRVLRKDGRMVVETVNPRSVVALVEAYFRDLTHEKPLHPATLDFMMRAAGFVEVEIRYSSPVSERTRLLPILEGEPVLKQNFEKLNALLFAEQDYAAIATKR